MLDNTADRTVAPLLLKLLQFTPDQAIAALAEQGEQLTVDQLEDALERIVDDRGRRAFHPRMLPGPTGERELTWCHASTFRSAADFRESLEIYQERISRQAGALS